MPKALNIISDEHRSIAAILHGMKYLVDEIRERGRKIDPRVFRAMLYYLDTFSEREHHRKEDEYLLAAIRRRGKKEADALVEELEKEHASGTQALHELERAFLRYEEAGEREFDGFVAAVEKFSGGYWEHMRKEEERLFPLARKLLTAEDWADVDRAFEQNRDPLAGGRDTQDFQKLFTRIVNIAPPPIGVGPSAGG